MDARLCLVILLLAGCGQRDAERSSRTDDRTADARRRLPAEPYLVPVQTGDDITIEVSSTGLRVPSTMIEWPNAPALPTFEEELERGDLRAWLDHTDDDGTFVVGSFRHAGSVRYQIGDGSKAAAAPRPPFDLGERSPAGTYSVGREGDVVVVRNTASESTVLSFPVHAELDRWDHGFHSQMHWLDDKTFSFSERAVTDMGSSTTRETVWDVPAGKMLCSLETEGRVGHWLIRADGYRFDDYSRLPRPKPVRTRATHARDGITLDVPGELLALTPDASRVVVLDAATHALWFLDRDGTGLRIPVVRKSGLDLGFATLRVELSPSGRYAVWSNDGELGAVDLENGSLHGGAPLLEFARAH